MVEERKGDDLRTDEQLMASLLIGQHEALQALHHRHAPLVFHIACRSLDAPSAEEITQDVFLQVWQKAATFDPARGSFRSWALQITHHRVLNELRHRGRRPKVDGNSEASLVDLSAHDPGPEELVWNEYRRSTIQRALAALPQTQAQALRLAFFQDLTHEQVAGFLDVPLGTAKSRIRVAIEKLTPRLAALVAMLVGAVGFSAYEWSQQRRIWSLDERAIGMLTGSHMEALRLEPLEPLRDAEKGPHATYRAERGGSVIAFTLSNIPQAPPGETYRIWQFNQGSWKALGEITPDAQGKGRRLIDAPGSEWPEALKLTQERRGSTNAVPEGQAILIWPLVGPRKEATQPLPKKFLDAPRTLNKNSSVPVVSRLLGFLRRRSRV